MSKKKKEKSETKELIGAGRLVFKHMKGIPLPKNPEQVEDYLKMLYDKILKEESLQDESTNKD